MENFNKPQFNMDSTGDGGKDKNELEAFDQSKENIKINKVKVRPFSYYEKEYRKRMAPSSPKPLPKLVDDDSFVELAQKIFSFGNRGHVDIKFTNDQFCVLVMTKSSHDFNASTELYSLEIWKKGEGIASSKAKVTKAKIMPGRDYRRGVDGTTSRDLSNYLLTEVSLEGNKIKFEGKSEAGDVNILEYYELY